MILGDLDVTFYDFVLPLSLTQQSIFDSTFQVHLA